MVAVKRRKLTRRTFQNRCTGWYLFVLKALLLASFVMEMSVLEQYNTQITGRTELALQLNDIHDLCSKDRM
jgi:hypothetical protein